MRIFLGLPIAFALIMSAGCKERKGESSSATEASAVAVPAVKAEDPTANPGKKIPVKAVAGDAAKSEGANLTALALGGIDLFGIPTSCPPSTPDCGVQAGGSDSRGINGDSDFNVYFFDQAGTTPLPGREGTIQIYDWSGTSVVWESHFTTDGNGFYRSQKIWGARGLPVKVCRTGYIFGYSNGQFLVYDFLAANACASGVVNSNGLLTKIKLFMSDPQPVALNIVELIQTGSYCPPKAQIITQDSVSIPLLGLLGICRKLDTQVFGKVTSDDAGTPVSAAEVDLTFDTTSPTPIHEIVYSGSDGKFTSSKVARVRGKPITACVKVKNFARTCQTTVAPTSDTNAYFDSSVPGSKSIQLIPNKEPVGSFTLSAKPNAEGYYPDTVVLEGWAIDPDYNDAPVTVALQVNGVMKTVLANLPSDGPCTTYSICDRPNAGFRVDLSGLPLNIQYSSVVVAMKNKPQPPQDFTDIQYQPFPTNDPVMVQNRSVSFWPETSVPTLEDSNDPKAVELGTKFTSDVDGSITGLKFYKSGANTGTHKGTLWSSTGVALASVTFANETAAGWQVAALATPVAITKGTTYTVSYHTNVGHYAADANYFQTKYDRAPLHVPAGGGVYLYGAGGFPKTAAVNSSYWVDVVFTPPVPPDTTPPTVTSVSPASGATKVLNNVAPIVLFSEAMTASTVTSSTVFLKDNNGAVVPSTLAFDAAANKATMTPASGLTDSSVYSVVVKGGSSGVKDLAGNALVADLTSSFTTGTTVVPPPTGFTIVADAPSQLTASWTSGGGTTVGYWIAYSATTIAPVCTGGIQISTTSRSRNDFGSDKTFSISVCAYDAAGHVSTQVSGYQTTLKATGTPPPAPTNFAISVDSQSQFTMTWTSGGGDTAGFYVAFGGGTSTPLCSNGIKVGNKTSYTRSDLSPSSTYTVAVCAHNANDVVSDQLKATATTSAAVVTVPTPTGFTVVADAPGQLTASWTSGGGATVGYWVALAPGSGGTACTSGNKTGPVTTYVRNDLGADKTYTISVCARDADGGISNVVSATKATMAATGTPPPAPTNIVFTANSSSKVTTTWISGGGTTAGFYVAYGIGNAVPTCSNGLRLGNNTSYVRTDMSPSTKYTVAVCAYDATENTSTPISATVTTPAPVESVPAPTGFSIVADLPAQLTASWTSGGGATVGYWIAYSANSTPPLCTGGIQINKTTYSRVLASNKTFSISVCAYDADGNLSAPVSGTKTTN